MQTEPFIEVLKSKGIKFALSEPMKNHTTFRIGGAADIFITVSSEEQLCAALAAAREYGVPVFCVGKGSNLLVSDGGIEGAVISLSGLNEIKISGNIISCGAGAALSALCIAARNAGLSGLEFAYGIPGSAGGAVFMNAGAYGGEISDVVRSVRAADMNGNIYAVSAADLKFGYRTSAFRENGLIILSAEFELRRAEYEEINGKMEELLNKRREKQPLEYPSAGSAFKRPTGYFAGALIEKNGLKGARVGGAQVSVKHAGFIVNAGGASASDVLKLIEEVKEKVLRADGVMLEPEILFVGRKEEKL